MSAKNGVHITQDVVAGLRRDIEKEEIEIRLRQQRVASLKRRAEAAEIILESEEGNPVPVETLTAEDSEEEGDSVADRLLADMRKSGQSLKVKQVKARLIELGFGDLLKTKPTYVYGLVYRLTKSTKLLKRGAKYRAAPADSSQEETGAVGAPVRH